MEIFKNILLYLFISIVVNLVSLALGSHFLSSFLETDLILLLITLLAINTATSGLLISSIKEVSGDNNEHFHNSFREIRLSILEQIWLIGTSIILLVLNSSTLIKKHFLYHDLIFDILLGTIFTYAIYILKDTALAIFKILKIQKGDVSKKKE